MVLRPVSPPLNTVKGVQYTVIGPLNNTPASPFDFTLNPEVWYYVKPAS